MTTLNNDLQKCTVEDNQVILPDIATTPLEDYQALRKALMSAGGKYSRNKFIFTSPAQPIVDQISNGDTNMRKRTQYFWTPRPVAEIMLSHVSWQTEMRILEPSAGRGELLGHLLDIMPHWVKPKIVTIEIEPLYYDELIQRYPADMWEVGHINGDFLDIEVEAIGKFDLIIANPPFTQGQDIKHIRHMVNFVENYGQIITLSSPSWMHHSGKKYQDFKKWINNEMSPYVNTLDRDMFNDTSIAPVLISM